MTALISRPAGRLGGSATVPGDKSMSHRALILGASAVGETRVSGLLEAEDVLATAEALRRFGAAVVRDGGVWRVQGCGVGGLREPEAVLDMGNAGTGVRLLMGLAASHPFTTVFTGDASLTRRPMGRVIEPLTRMGAEVRARGGGRLPLAVVGAPAPMAITYPLPVASAQVKSAILLAALNAAGRTTVIEPRPTRDHTERMLSHFGVDVRVEDGDGAARRVSIEGEPEIAAAEVSIPADISSAAFPLVASLLVEGSKVVLPGVGVNPLRTGLLDTLAEMGARISVTNPRTASGEAIADIAAEAGPLRGVVVPEDRVPSMIDEFPVLAAAAAVADGTTRMSGLAELRVKESDRLSAIARGLEACGVAVEEGDDWLVIRGAGGPPPGGGTIATGLDHRIAMAFLVLGAACREPVAVDDGGPIDTSFPGFDALMNGLGARIEPGGTG